MLASQAPAVLDIGDRVERRTRHRYLQRFSNPCGVRLSSRSPHLQHTAVVPTPVDSSEVREAVSTPWLHGLEPGTKLFMPMAHGEGNYYHPEGDEAVKALSSGVYQESERIERGCRSDAGHHRTHPRIMPHPERAADATLGSDDGLAIFKQPEPGSNELNRHTDLSMFAASETIDVTDAKKLAADFGLSDREYAHVEKTLGRVPTRTELGVFAGMWSEHCSYSQPSIG